MDTLESMRVFARIAECGSFAAAARKLDISAAAATKHVGHLEQRLGARLLNRSTRRLSLTEAGRAYYERCVELLQGIAEAISNVDAIDAALAERIAIAPVRCALRDVHALMFPERYPGYDPEHMHWDGARPGDGQVFEWDAGTIEIVAAQIEALANEMADLAGDVA